MTPLFKYINEYFFTIILIYIYITKSIYIYNIKSIVNITILCIFFIFVCYTNAFCISNKKGEDNSFNVLIRHNIRAQLAEERKKAKAEGRLEEFEKNLKEKRAEEQRQRVAAWKAKKREEKKLSQTEEERKKSEAHRKGQLKRIERRQEVKKRIEIAIKEGNEEEVRRTILQEEIQLKKERDLKYKEDKQVKILLNNPPLTEFERLRRLAISETQAARHANDKILAKKEEELIKTESVNIVKEKIKREKLQRIKQNRARWSSENRAAKRAALSEDERKKSEARSQGQRERQQQHREREEKLRKALEEGRLEEVKKEIDISKLERKKFLKNRQLMRNSVKHSEKQMERWLSLPEEVKNRRMRVSQRCIEYHRSMKEIRKKSKSAEESGGIEQFLEAFSEELQLKEETIKRKKQRKKEQKNKKKKIKEKQSKKQNIDIGQEADPPLMEDEYCFLLGDLQSSFLPFEEVVLESEQTLLTEEVVSEADQAVLTDLKTIDPSSLDLQIFQKENTSTCKEIVSSNSNSVGNGANDITYLESNAFLLQQSEERQCAETVVSECKNTIKELVLVEEDSIPSQKTRVKKQKRQASLAASIAISQSHSKKLQMLSYIDGYNKKSQIFSLKSLQGIFYSPKEQMLARLKNFVLQNDFMPKDVDYYEYDREDYTNTIVQYPIIRSNIMVKNSCSSLKRCNFFGYSKNNSKNLEIKPSSCQIGIITNTKSGLSLSLAYNRDKDKVSSFSHMIMEPCCNPAQSTINSDCLSSLFIWDPNYSGFKGYIVTAYGWGQMKNTRYAIHNKKEICTKGEAAVTMYGSLYRLGYTLPLKKSIMFTPYIENSFVQIAWKSYNEHIGVLPCKISNYKERTYERNIGVHISWTDKDCSLLQAWAVISNRRHISSKIESVPLSALNSFFYLSKIPGNKKEYTQKEVGISYKRKVIERVAITFDSKFFYKKHNNGKEVECNIHYIF